MAVGDSTPRKYRPRLVELPEAKRPCSNCGQPRGRKGQRLCRTCHAAYMRANRKPHSALSPEQRKKANARSYARMCELRGQIVRQPCETCGDMFAEKHHEDYDQPAVVRWLCRGCHLKEHKEAA